MDFPISFYITKYELTADRYEEMLNDSVFTDDIGHLGYGTYLRRVENMHFQEGYEDWIVNEIHAIETYGLYTNHEPQQFAVAGRKGFDSEVIRTRH